MNVTRFPRRPRFIKSGPSQTNLRYGDGNAHLVTSKCFVEHTLSKASPLIIGRISIWADICGSKLLTTSGATRTNILRSFEFWFQLAEVWYLLPIEYAV